MRHIVFFLVLILTPIRGSAFEIEDTLVLGPTETTRELRIISTTDVSLFRPVLETFMALNPDLRVQYVVTSSTELMTALADQGAQFDIAISSAMDLQTKLANDRLTRPYASGGTAALPDWARWRQDVFAFTQEPAAIVISRRDFAGLDLPATRDDLITILRTHPDRFKGRIGTYDLRQSGLGYLFATQDSRMSEVYWRLTEVMGALDARLYGSSGAMIDDVASGRLAVAYNALGSYALSRPDREKYLVLFPQDFTTVMMRTVLIPATARRPDIAGRFIDFLLAEAWDETKNPSSLGFLDTDLQNVQNRLRRIRLGPGLLIFLDSYKKRRFLTAWEKSILQD